MGSLDLLLARVGLLSPAEAEDAAQGVTEGAQGGLTGQSGSRERALDPLVRVKVHSLVLGEAECLRRTWIPPCLPWGVFMI